MKQSITERLLTPKELEKRDQVIKQLKTKKSSLVKRYGNIAEKVMYGRATNIAKKTVENMNKDKVREMIKKTLMSPIEEKFTKEFDTDPALKGGQRRLPDELQNSIIKKAKNEDIDLGHQDDEPDMLKASVYRIAQYAAGLYKMLDKYDQMDQEVDFPDWWQEKIHLAADYMDKAKHYLEFEEKQPALDAMIQEESKFFASKENVNLELVQKVEDFIREVAQDYSYGVDDAYFAIMQVLKAGLVNEGVNEEEAEAKDAVDTVTMDVPLFIRMLEFAREDAKADVDLHDVAEKAIEINKSKETLSMQDYEDIIPAMEEPMNESNTTDIENKIKSGEIDPKEVEAAAKKAMNGDSTDLALLMVGLSNMMNEAKPSAGMTAKERSSLSKKAHAGKDIGKKGKGFEKVAAAAGGGEKGEKIAAAAMWKNAAKKSSNESLAEKIMAKLKKPMVKEEATEDEKYVVWINVDKTGKKLRHTLNSKAEAQKIGQRVKNNYYDDYDTEVGMMSLSDWNKEKGL